MNVNSINWDEVSIGGGTVQLTEVEFRAFAAYRCLYNAMRDGLLGAKELFTVVWGNVLDRYYKLRFGTKLNTFGEVVANIEYCLNKHTGQVKVRRFTGNDGAFKWIKGKLVKVRSSGRFSELSEGNVERARIIATELVDNDLEKKLDEKSKKTEKWEMAMSKRNYGFNTQWVSGLNHERGN
jgi:hypothetical protein